MKAVELKTEFMSEPLGIDIRQPLLSWKCRGGKMQSAYRVICRNGQEVLFDSGKTKSSEMNCRYTGRAESRERIFWNVTLWDENGEEESSEEAFFEYALLEREFCASWIDPEIAKIDPETNQPASYLHKEFELEDTERSRIYATARGLYVLYINSVRVDDQQLCPGTSEYAYRHPYQTFDAEPYLRKGHNVIDVVLGDGWWRGCNGNTGTRNVFGSDIAFLFQLEVDKRPVVVSDASWTASQNGPIRFNDLQLGEKIDARLTEIRDYHEVAVRDYGFANLVCSNSVPIVQKEQFSAKLLHTPDGNKVLDFSQNLAGWVSFSVSAKEGQKLKLTLGEYLDGEGNFSDKNFETIGRRQQLHQIIEYTCKEGRNEYRSQLCISGFRYALLETDIEVDGTEFTSHAVYSDIEQTAWFHCDHELVNRLFENAVWSTKSNFVDIPTDCPQRERSGWTGDAALYAYTGLRIMDTYPVFRRWLAEERAVQYEDGRVRNFAPRRSPKLSFMDKLYDGSTAWGDCSVIVPYEMYRFSGDREILKENYRFMKKWLQYCEKKAKKSRLRNLFDPYKNYIIDTGIHYGEWLEAGISMQEGMKEVIFKGVPEIATAYFAYSCRLMSEIAEILEEKEDAVYYRELAARVREAYCHLEMKDGKIGGKRQCRLVRPLAMDLLDEETKKNVAAELNELVIENGYHLNTGFLTTPHLCRVLAENGYIDTACRILLQEETPGWLFAVKNGATTIWESWEGCFGDIGVASLNHYSKGAVVSWLIDGICGIKTAGREVSVRPQITSLMNEASAVYDSPLGRICSFWKRENGSLRFEVELPANAKGTLTLPDGREETLMVGCNRFSCRDSAAKE